jgi:hypothetical protein
MFLQALLTTMLYETSLTLAMPADTADPLMPPIPYTEILFDYDQYKKDEGDGEERAGLMQGEPKRVRDANPFHYPPRPTASTSGTNASNTHESPSTTFTSHPAASPSDPTSASTSYLPPREPIVNLRVRHIVHRLTSPAPVPPPSEDATEDNLGDLTLPLPNTAGAGGLARTIRILAQANARRQMRLRLAEERARRTGGGGGSRRDANSTTGLGSERSRRGAETSPPNDRATNPDDVADANVRIPGGMYPPDS